MSRIKIVVPENFSFQCIIPIRITDINYGNHVGNDSMLSIIHEARMQYLQSLGYSEMDVAGVGLIMSDASIEFKSELFYGDNLQVAVAAGDFSRIGFNLYYRLEKITADKKTLIATAKTGMICFDYTVKKIVAIPEEVLKKLK